MRKIRAFFSVIIIVVINKIAELLTFFAPGAYLKSIVRGKVLGLKLKKTGRNLLIDQGVTINYPNFLAVGDNVYFARNVWMNAHYGIEIGNNVQLSPMVVIATGSHNITDEGIDDNGKCGAVNIGSNVWISSHSIVSAGVKIGDNVIIGANTVVLTDVPDNVLFAGVPGRIIKKII